MRFLCCSRTVVCRVLQCLNIDQDGGNQMKRQLFSFIGQNRVLSVMVVLFFLVVFFLTWFTPMVSDDFAYSFSFADWTRITSIAQIFPSMAVHRDSTNGRVLVHGLVQFFLLLPKPVFSIANALMSVLVWSTVRKLLPSVFPGQKLAILLFGVFFICCFTPALGENYFWLDGSLNYFWGLAASLFFLYPFLKDWLFPFSEKRSRISVLLRILLAFYAGTCSESFSLVFLVLALCLFVLRWRETRQFDLIPAIWLMFALLGYLFLMTAPATSGRAGLADISVWGYQFRTVFREARNRLLWPFLIFAALYALALVYQAEKKILAVSMLLFLGGLASLVSYTFAAYILPRHLCCTVFLTMLACVLLLAALCRAEKAVFSSVSLACLSVLFFLQFPVGVLDIAVSHHKQQLREQAIARVISSGGQSVVLENYYPYSSYGVAFELDPADPTVGPNINIAEYYGVDSILGKDPPPEG